MTLWEIENNCLWGGERPSEENDLYNYNIESLSDINHKLGIYICRETNAKFKRGKDYIP